MHHKSHGFSLAETLIYLSISSLLLTMAIPGYQQMCAFQHLSSAGNDLASALSLARSEAIKRGRPVLVSSNDGNWGSGWRVHADSNGNGIKDNGEPLLLEQRPFEDGVRIIGNSPVRHFVRYVPSGASQLPSGAFQAGTLTICHASGQPAKRHLVISATGRVRREKGTPGPC